MTVDNKGYLVPVGQAKDVAFGGTFTQANANIPGGIGVIIPPPDLRAIVDKTALFIAKNGENFESRILANEKNNNKFNFLQANDPYQAYYRAKINEIRNEEKGVQPKSGEQTLAPVSGTPSVVLKQDEQVKKSVVVDQVLEPPSEEDYTVRVPEGLTALDLDVIRLTAQFGARNGKKFLTGLTSREHNNPQFHFLKPTHSMFSFFTELTDAYSKVLMPSKKSMQNLEKDAKDAGQILARCLQRLEWMRVQEEEKRAKESKEEAERTAMALIDWHDFGVVETIDFYDDEDMGLPEPLAPKDLVSIAKAEPEAVEQEDAAMEMEMDEEEMELVAEGAAQEIPASKPIMPPPEPEMKIVKNYKRLSQSAQGKEQKGAQLVVSPITGELVPVDDMAEHMRISLIDPKWRQQRDAMLAKIKDSTKASDDEIARNVSALADTRPDIFGSTEEEISRIVAAEIARSKKAALLNEKRVSETPMQPPAGGPPVAMPPRPPMPHHMQGRPGDPGFHPGMVPFPHSQVPGMPGRPPMPPMPGGPMPPGRRPMPPMPPGGPPMPPMPPMPPGGPPMPPMPGGPMPPGGPRGAPPLPPVQPPPPPPGEDGPEIKRARLEESGALQPEAEWLATHPGSASIKIKLPVISGKEKMDGSILEVNVNTLGLTIQQLKKLLTPNLNLAVNKQKLQIEGIGFLKDNLTLAHYNVSEETMLSLGLKERGGKKK